MKLFWTGTDVLMMNDLSKRPLRKYPYWLIVRLIVRFMDRFFIENHVTNSVILKGELEQFGVTRPIELWPTPLLYDKIEKKEHEGFNVLYYKPYKSDIKFRDWLYGIDLIEGLKEDFPEANFIECSRGYGKDLDMKEIYPIVDIYVRPNRHDGLSRMVRECMLNDIPVYWSHTNPDYSKMKQKVYEALQNSRKV